MSIGIPMTKLEAVNAMLFDVGDRPVNTLSGTTRLDVERAESTLDQVSRSVQQKGWFFNTTRVELALDGSNQYPIPTNYVHVEVESGGPTSGQYGETPYLVVRNQVLFDVANNTNVFASGSTITAIVHVLLDYEELPNSAREYIYATASVRNQSRALGSRNVDQELREVGRVALAAMLEEEVDSTDFDVTTSPRFITMMHDA